MICNKDSGRFANSCLYFLLSLNFHVFPVVLVHLSRPRVVRRLSVVNLSHFRLLLRNPWMELNPSCQEARSQRPIPCLCFSGRSENQDDRICLWLADTFLTCPLKPLNAIQRYLARRSQRYLPSVCFFSGQSKNQGGRLGLWLAETILTSPNSLNGI